MSWQRTTADGQTILPWHRLTEERLSPEARAIIAKVARSVLNDIRDEAREKLLADLTEFYQGLTTAIERDHQEEEAQ